MRRSVEGGRSPHGCSAILGIRVDTPASQDDAGANGTGTGAAPGARPGHVRGREAGVDAWLNDAGEEGEAYHAAPPPGLRAEAAASVRAALMLARRSAVSGPSS